MTRKYVATPDFPIYGTSLDLILVKKFRVRQSHNSINSNSTFTFIRTHTGNSELLQFFFITTRALYINVCVCVSECVFLFKLFHISLNTQSSSSSYEHRNLSTTKRQRNEQRITAADQEKIRKKYKQDEKDQELFE